MAPVRTRAIRTMLKEHEGILSFDVFDTLLWRRYPRPIDVFHDIPRAASRSGAKLPTIAGTAFAAARRRAESSVREIVADRFGTAEVTLAQIHEQLAMILGWDATDPAVVEALGTAELAAERDALVADHELLELVHEQRAEGRRVIAVSDSYFAPSHITDLLVAAGYPRDAFERVFVSSSFGMSKADGLFGAVVQELGVHPARLLHVGDLPAADVDPLRELGGRSVRWTVARDEAIEMAIRECGSDDLPMRTTTVDGEPTAADAGVTALRARLVAPEDVKEPGERVLSGYERFGRLVSGPVLLGFATWVCSRARELGLDRLYFFQREGALLSELVGRVAAAHGQRLDTRVLAVSRSALAPARHASVDLAYFEDLLESRRPRRASAVVTEIGLGRIGLPGWTNERLVTMDDADELHRAVTTDPARADAVQRTLDARRVNVWRYLRAAVDIDAAQIGVVDLGWAGSIQRSLSSALAEVGFAGTLRGLYLATNRGAERHLTPTNLAEGFVANLESPPRMAPIFRNPEMIEQCCLERTGSVAGYEDGEVVRARDDVPDEQWVAIERVQAGIRTFFDAWAAQPHSADDGHTQHPEVWRAVARDILLRSCADPTRTEIELFRGWLHDDNKGTNSVEQLVPHLFEEPRAAAAILSEALNPDELLWASAVSTLNGGAPSSTPVRVAAGVLDASGASAVPARAVVARQAGDVIAIYVGAEVRRAGAVRLSVVTGPAIVRIVGATIELQAGDEVAVEQAAELGTPQARFGTRLLSADRALVKGSTMRLTIPLGPLGQRLPSEQRLRVLVELAVERIEPKRSRLAGVARARGVSAMRLTLERGVPTAVELARQAGAGKVARDALDQLRRVMGSSAGGHRPP